MQLEKNVLFIDEALPSPTSEKSSKLTEIQPEIDPKSRLKFLRNLGRVLLMRVVLAGTGATAANMRTMPNNASGSSREEREDCTWAEVEFLYRPIIYKEDRPQIKYRPLLHNWLSEHRIDDSSDNMEKKN